MTDVERFKVVRTHALVLTPDQRAALADVVFAATLARAWFGLYAPDATVNQILPPHEREAEDAPLMWILERALATYRATGAMVVFPEEERADDSQ